MLQMWKYRRKRLWTKGKAWAEQKKCRLNREPAAIQQKQPETTWMKKAFENFSELKAHWSTALYARWLQHRNCNLKD